MRIGVTGASGMLGTALLKSLPLNNDRRLFAVSRKKGLERDNILWNCFDLNDKLKLKTPQSRSICVNSKMDLIRTHHKERLASTRKARPIKNSEILNT